MLIRKHATGMYNKVQQKRRQLLTHADWPRASTALVTLMTEPHFIIEWQQVLSRVWLWLQHYKQTKH